MTYNFGALSHADFEDLVRDLIGRDFGIEFEAFGAGPDGGIDGRHSVGRRSTILQAKHYLGSTFASLRSVMRKERKSIDRIKPDRYVLATSRPLSPNRKGELAEIVGPSLRSENDIFGPGDLNRLLRKFPDIEKAHIKLWLSSTAVLEQVVRAASQEFTSTTAMEIEAKVRVYAQNPSFSEARVKLEEGHVVIISGPPGVGKTTLAEMLCYSYLGEGWELRAMRSLDDGFAAIVDSKRQVFYFDDFLGQVALDPRALALRDSDLSKFMRRMRTSQNARFVLTTRAYILEEARRISEHLSHDRVDVARYILDVGVYTRRIRARILYNHLVVAETPGGHIDALIDNEVVSQIVDHRNYNPRVIEWMTDADHIRGISAQDYPRAFIESLDNPTKLWDTAFRTHIPLRCQHLVIALFFHSAFGAEIEDVRRSYESLHLHLCKKYQQPHSAKDFEESLKILEGGFVSIAAKRISYINPSLRDYMGGYLNDAGLLIDAATASTKASWADAVWTFARECSTDADFLCSIALGFVEFAPRLLELPVWKRSDAYPGAIFNCDQSNSDRISLLIAWWDATRSTDFADIALQLADHPSDKFDAWNDGDSIVELIRSLRIGIYDEFPYTEEIAVKMENSLIGILRSSINSEDLERLSDALDYSRNYLSPHIFQYEVEAIRREFSDVRTVTSEIDSSSTLEDHANALRKLADRAGVGADEVSRAIDVIQERIARIEEEEERYPGTASRGNEIRQPEKFGDKELADLFGLLRYRS